MYSNNRKIIHPPPLIITKNYICVVNNGVINVKTIRHNFDNDNDQSKLLNGKVKF